jgi:hypothetical protein
MDELADVTLATIAAGYCPDCGGAGFRLGPRGGGSQNIECMTCRARFNVLVRGWDVLVGHRLDVPEHVQRARAGYRDDSREPRQCDYCGATYRGPAVYCSHECALAEAQP